MFWARLAGAEIILIDSFARFERPSLFARIAAPLAHHRIVQSKALGGYWPGTHIFDPLKLLEGERPEKQSLLFATVGGTLPFNRLVERVLALKAAGEIPEDVVLQRSEEHTSELQSLMRISYAVFCLYKQR